VLEAARQWAGPEERVRALLDKGSIATGGSDELSDIDLVFVSNPDLREELRRAARGLGQAGEVSYVPQMRTQLVAARTVAEALADLTTDPEATVSEIAGPREESLVDAAKLLAARRGDPKRVEGVSDPERPGQRALSDGRPAAWPRRHPRRPHVRGLARLHVMNRPKPQSDISPPESMASRTATEVLLVTPATTANEQTSFRARIELSDTPLGG
jgi:hypothetical protein